MPHNISQSFRKDSSNPEEETVPCTPPSSPDESDVQSPSRGQKRSLNETVPGTQYSIEERRGQSRKLNACVSEIQENIDEGMIASSHLPTSPSERELEEETDIVNLSTMPTNVNRRVIPSCARETNEIVTDEAVPTVQVRSQSEIGSEKDKQDVKGNKYRLAGVARQSKSSVREESESPQEKFTVKHSSEPFVSEETATSKQRSSSKKRKHLEVAKQLSKDWFS